MHRRRRSFIPITLLTALLVLAPGAAFAKSVLWAAGDLDPIPVGKPGTAKIYLKPGAGGLNYPVIGPGALSGFVKVHYGPGETGEKRVVLRYSGIDGLPDEQELVFTAPKRGEYGDGRAGMPSAGRKIALSIPDRGHILNITGEATGGAEFFLILYYEGPEQPLSPDFKPPEAAKAPEPKKPFFKWRSSASVSFIYDDNPFKYSNEFAKSYFDGSSPEALAKFYRVERFDDLIISPTVKLEARRKQFSLGETRLAVQFSTLQYWHNSVLTNGEFRVIMRQNVGKGKSFEVFYSYSPAKYLRRLNDRPPNVSDNTPVVSEAFLLTRNNIVAAWRHKLGKKLSGKLQVTKQLYYYNKPHVENDMSNLDFRGTLYWKFSKPWQLTLDYAYKIADGLAIDVEGQTLETSPASDGTHKKNMYQGDLRWKPPFKWLIAQIGVRARYAVAYFPAEGTTTISDDEYHVGRQDNEYAYRVYASRSLKEIASGLSGEIGFQYAERDVDSPWWGDIKEDKNWISRTLWFKLSYRLL